MRRLRVFRDSTAFCLCAYGWVVQRHVSFAAPRYMWCVRLVLLCCVQAGVCTTLGVPSCSESSRSCWSASPRPSTRASSQRRCRSSQNQVRRVLHQAARTRGGFCCAQPLWRRCVCWGVVAQVTICQRWMRLCLVCSGVLMQCCVVDVALVCLLAQARPLRTCLPLPHWLPPRLSRPQAAPNTYPPPR